MRSPGSARAFRLCANRSSTVSRGSSPVSGSNVERSSDTYSIAFWRNSNRRTPVSYTGRSRSSSRITSATACLPLS